MNLDIFIENDTEIVELCKTIMT